MKLYRYLLPIRIYIQARYRVSDSFSFGSLHFENKIGLSAGFDKNAEIFDELADLGFGFLELGTVTPDSQPGNSSPRIFRLVEDKSLISRAGFNNLGGNVVLEHIKKYRTRSYVLGVNINKNPLSSGEQIIKDFEFVFTRLYDFVDYFTLNWGLSGIDMIVSAETQLPKLSSIQLLIWRVLLSIAYNPIIRSATLSIKIVSHFLIN